MKRSAPGDSLNPRHIPRAQNNDLETVIVWALGALFIAGVFSTMLWLVWCLGMSAFAPGAPQAVKHPSFWWFAEALVLINLLSFILWPRNRQRKSL